MNPKKIDLETPLEFYNKIRDRKLLTKNEITRLIKFVDEVKYIVQFAKLGPQGHKSAVNIFNKLSTLESRHRIRTEVKKNQGLFTQ